VWRGLTLGFSGTQGHKPGSNAGAGSNIVNGDLKYVRYGGDVSYVNVPVGFTIEYVQGNDEALRGTTPANTTLYSKSSYGATATIFYEWGQQFVKDYINQSRQDDYYPQTYQLFVRSDTWNPNTGIPGFSVTEGTLGFNAFFASTTKLELAYQARKDEGHNFASDQYLTQFQYGF
jgi:hypothetical protein